MDATLLSFTLLRSKGSKRLKNFKIVFFFQYLFFSPYNLVFYNINLFGNKENIERFSITSTVNAAAEVTT